MERRREGYLWECDVGSISVLPARRRADTMLEDDDDALGCC